MNKNRLEAFSDGVLAIIITIMVLEFKVPHSGDWQALQALLPTFLCYALSFTYVGIYWNNHHHMMHTVKHVDAAIMWTNLLLLFWLSLIPFATAWMGENHFPSLPVAVYAVVLIMSGTSYDLVRRSIIRSHPLDHDVRTLLGHQNRKSVISTSCYFVAIPMAFFVPAVSLGLFTLVAVIWFIPDQDIEKSAKE